MIESLPHLLYVPMIGFLVGALVSATGVGGGVLLLPLLVIILRVPPIVAVGTGMIFMFLTKLCASVAHYRHKNVDWNLVVPLLSGSLPGALTGVALLAYLHNRWGEGVNHFLRSIVGLLLVVLPILILITDHLKAQSSLISRSRPGPSENRFGTVATIGAFGGFLVGLTSIGEGSLIILLLFLFVRLPPNTLVATDILHGMVLSGVLSAAHLRMGTPDLRLVILLVMGSCFGVIYGSKLATTSPPLFLRRIILALLIPIGIGLL